MQRLIKPMRLSFLVLVCLLASGAAEAVTPAGAGASADDLRGPVAAQPLQPAPTPLDSHLPNASFAGDSALGQTDAGQCRLACARTYYFCLASEGATGCPENWSQCASSCARGPAPLPPGAE